MINQKVITNYIVNILYSNKPLLQIMDISTWKWNPRYDLDLAQRCLFIVGFTWISDWVYNLMFLNYLFGDSVVHLLGTAALLMAIAKSSLQLPPKGKSILVTGKKLFHSLWKKPRLL